METSHLLVINNEVLIALSQRIVIILASLGVAYFLSSWPWIKRCLLGVTIVYLVITAEAFLSPGWFGNQWARMQNQFNNKNKQIPGLVKAEADRMIISRVGADNFSQMYLFDSGQSVIEEVSNQRRSYLVAYRFLPVSELVDDDVVFIRVTNEAAIETIGIPNCLINPQICLKIPNRVQLEKLLDQSKLIEPEFKLQKSADGFRLIAVSCSQTLAFELDYLAWRLDSTSAISWCN